MLHRERNRDRGRSLVARSESSDSARHLTVHSASTGANAIGASAIGTTAIGAIAMGALAIGALAIGALAIRRLAINRARIRRLEIDELVVRKLSVIEDVRVPANAQAASGSDGAADIAGRLPPLGEG